MIDLQEWIAHPELLGKESLYTLRNLLARYPYFQTARLLYLKNLYLLHDPSFGEELCHSVIYITNRAFLYHFIEGDLKLALQKKTPDSGTEAAGDRTLAIIDAFLASVPEESSYAAIGNEVATDYTSYLMKQEDEAGTSEETAVAEVAPLRGQDLIDRFIEKADEGSFFHTKAEQGETDLWPVEEDDLPEEEAGEETEAEDDSCFTETLAKIYIKQQRYAKALEIIKKLSLKYPKKALTLQSK